MVKDIRIKIVHVLHSFDIGGLENGIVNLINGLDWERYTHVICCLTRSGRMLERLKRTDTEILELHKRPGPDWCLPFRLGRIFQRVRPHIVHTRNFGTIDGILGSQLSRVPTVFHGEHGRTISDVNCESLKRKLARRVLSPLVDRFVAVSRELKDWLENQVGISPGKVTMIYNGVDTDMFVPSCGSSLRSQLGIGQDDFLVGTVGRLDPVKDQATLIVVFSQLAQSYPEAKLLIVGNGSCQENLMSLARQLRISERVIFTGERDDVPPILQMMDVFVLPSLAEGISNTILEAMATGLAVIATRVGGNPELVIEGQTGLLVQSQNVDRLRDALLVYLRTPSLAIEHGVRARQRVVREFSLNTMVKAYDALYSGACS